MRSNHTPPGEAARSVSRSVPVEWLDSGSWRLPSGKALAEFALQAGFLAPLLFRRDRSGFGKGSSPGSSGMGETAAAARAKHFDNKQFDKQFYKQLDKGASR